MSSGKRRLTLGGALALALACGAYALHAAWSDRSVEGGTAALPEHEQEPPDPPDQVIRLVRADGAPAAGVEAYGVEVDLETPLERLTLRPVSTGEAAPSFVPEHCATDVDGFLGIDRSAILAVRLTPDAIALLPIDAGTIELPELASVELELDSPAVAGALRADLVVRSADLAAWMVGGWRAPEGGFANAYEVHGWALAEPKVFAWRALLLSTDRSVQLRLPPESYTIEDAGGTPGWWVRPESFEVGSDRKVLVHPYQPVTVQLSCLDPATGQRRRPALVVLRAILRAYDTAENGGWPLRWRIDGETLQVALENRQHTLPLGADSGSDDDYWFKVTWEDGGTSTTDRLGREELEGALELVDVAVRK